MVAIATDDHERDRQDRGEAARDGRTIDRCRHRFLVSLSPVVVDDYDDFFKSVTSGRALERLLRVRRSASDP